MENYIHNQIPGQREVIDQKDFELKDLGVGLDATLYVFNCIEDLYHLLNLSKIRWFFHLDSIF